MRVGLLHPGSWPREAHGTVSHCSRWKRYSAARQHGEPGIALHEGWSISLLIFRHGFGVRALGTGAFSGQCGEVRTTLTYSKKDCHRPQRGEHAAHGADLTSVHRYRHLRGCRQGGGPRTSAWICMAPGRNPLYYTRSLPCVQERTAMHEPFPVRSLILPRGTNMRTAGRPTGST